MKTRDPGGVGVQRQHRQQATAVRVVAGEAHDDEVRMHPLDLRVGVGDRFHDGYVVAAIGGLVLIAVVAMTRHMRTSIRS